MNDEDLVNLERELRTLRLKPPSKRLVSAIERQLIDALPAAEFVSRPRTYKVSWWGWITAGLPIAAAVIFGFLAAWVPSSYRNQPEGQAWNTTGETKTPALANSDTPMRDYRPVSAEKWNYGTQDEGIVTLADGTPARQWRERYVDTITWKNPLTRASMTWSVPRDEVRIVPVSAY